MVPVVVRLEKAGMCGCGAVVAAGERAGTTRQPGVVVCLSCVAAFSTDPDEVHEPEIDPPGVDGVPEVDGTVSEAAGAHASEVDEHALVVPEPVAVVIPADWGPRSPSSLPSWQRAAGVRVALPPAAPVSTRPVNVAPVVAVQIATPGAAEGELTPWSGPAGGLAPAVEVGAAAAVVEPVDPTPVAEPAAPTRVAEPPTPAPAVAAGVPAPAIQVGPPAPVVEEVPEVVAVSAEAVAMAPPSHRRRTFLPPGLLALRPSRGREPGSTGRSDPATRSLLESGVEAGILSLHDRRMPGRRGRIPHLAFGAGGVYVIDVVLAKNASVEVRPVDELEPEALELVVDGRAVTTTVEATQGRVEVVRRLLDEVELTTVPVIGVMYFIDATIPPDADLSIEGIHVVGRTGLPTLVDSEGALDPEHRETLRDYLADRLPA